MMSVFRRICAILFILILWCGAAAPARADSCSGTMTDMVFSNVSPIAAVNVNTSGTLTVTCTWTALTGIPPLLLFPNVTFCVYLGVGSGGTSGAYRAMLAGAAKLPYNLYVDTTYAPSAVWGGGAMVNTQPIAATMGGLLAVGTVSKTFAISGQIPGNALTGVVSGGGGDAAYASTFSTDAVLNYAFYGLTKPACTSGSTALVNFQARANVINDCVVNASVMDFGPTRVLTQAARATASLAVLCTANANYRVSLNGGLNGTVAARKMKNAVTGELISYTISSTLDGTVWGDGTAGSAPVAAVGTGAQQLITLFGNVGAQTTPTPGDYKDTVTATIYF